MATQSPLTRATSLAGSKKDLVDKVKALATDKFWIDRMQSDKGWSRLSNAKLLRLHAILTAASARFASRAELIEALAGAEGHGKDGDYKKSLEKWSLPRLMDSLRSAEHRAKLAAKPTRTGSVKAVKAASPVKAATATKTARPATAATATKTAKATKPAKAARPS